jgi:hypothetical protein
MWLVDQSTETGRLYFRWKFARKGHVSFSGLAMEFLEGFRLQVEGLKAKRHGR